MSRLYVARWGDLVKVGITVALPMRFERHRQHARAEGVTFEPLFDLPRHHEASKNETKIIRRFGPAVRGREYLRANADDVITFAQTLPCTLIPHSTWVTRGEAAEILQVSAATVDRYRLTGALPSSFQNEATRRVLFRLDEVCQLAGERLAMPDVDVATLVDAVKADRLAAPR